jgi:hypothetical protein
MFVSDKEPQACVSGISDRRIIARRPRAVDAVGRWPGLQRPTEAGTSITALPLPEAELAMADM